MSTKGGFILEINQKCDFSPGPGERREQKATKSAPESGPSPKSAPESGPSLKSAPESAPERGPFQKVRQKARLSCFIFAYNFLCFVLLF